MTPIDFPQSTKELQRPACMTDDECGSLHVWTDGNQCISCWKPSMRERVRILFGNPVWLGIMSGRTQPPVFVNAAEDVFDPNIRKTSKIITNARIFADDVRTAWNTIVSGFTETDKRKRFVTGFVLSFLFGMLNPFVGLAVGCVGGVLREWWKSYGRGYTELADVVFAFMGAAVAMPSSFWIHGLIFG